MSPRGCGAARQRARNLAAFLTNNHEREFMLILTRKVREAVLIGHNIKVVIDSVDGQRVRIGIEAPKDVKILREELEPVEKQKEKL